MRLEIGVQVRGEAVNVDVVSVGSVRRDKNETVLTSPDHQLLGIGGSYETPLDTVPIEHKVVRSFDVEKFDIPVSAGVLWFYVELAKNQAQTVKKRLVTLFDNIVLDLSWPDYDTLPVEQRGDFEFLVLDGTAANELRINGNTVGWPNWQRRVLKIWSLVATLGPLLVFLYFGLLPVTRWFIDQYPGDPRAPLNLPQDLLPLLLMLLGMIGVVVFMGLIVGVASFVLWVVVARVLLPFGLISRFVSSRTWRGVPQWVSQTVAGYTRSQSMQRYNVWQTRG